MFNKRVFVLSLGKSTLKVSVTRGCAQGGLLSPLLCTLLVDELIVLPNKDGL